MPAVDDNLLPVQSTYPARIVDTPVVKLKSRHRWFYLREQTPGETLLIEFFGWEGYEGATQSFSGLWERDSEESMEGRVLVLQPDDVE